MTLPEVLLTPIEQEFSLLFFSMGPVFLLLLNFLDGEFFRDAVLLLVLILIGYLSRVLLVVVQEGRQLFFMGFIFQVLNVDFTDSIDHTCGEGVKCF